ncbi:unnamed protein product, partial [Acanthocheilonema viteae]
TPNAIGMLLAIIQIALFLIFPMKQGRLSPIQRCFNPSCCAAAASFSSSDENGSHFEFKLLHYLNTAYTIIEKVKEPYIQEKNSLLSSNREPVHIAVIDEMKPEKSWISNATEKNGPIASELTSELIENESKPSLTNLSKFHYFTLQREATGHRDKLNWIEGF